MRTFNQMHNDCNRQGWSCVYYGDRGDWLVTFGQSRDSDTLETSNFAVAATAFEELDPNCYAIERESHWAVGWVEHLLIDPTNEKAVHLAETFLDKLADYPILDEEHFSNAEYENYIENWQSWGRYDYRKALVVKYPNSKYDIENLENDTLDAMWCRVTPRLNWEYSGDDINIEGGVDKTVWPNKTT